MRKMLGVALAGILVTGGMAACEGTPQPADPQPTGPQTTEELLERYEALEDRGNYTFDSKVDIDLGLGQQVTLGAQGEVTPRAAHMTESGSFLGHDATTECYVESEYVTFVEYRAYDINGSQVWCRSTVDDISPVDSLTEHDLLEKATFATTSDGYTLRMAGTDFLPALMGRGEGVVASLIQDEHGALAEALRSSEAVYAFDGDCELTGISCTVGKGTDGAGDAQEADGGTDAAGSAGVSVAISYTIGDYGTVDAEKVAVPTAVKDSALDLDEAMARFGQFADQVAGVAGGIADGIGKGVDRLGAYLENVDLSSIRDQVGQTTADAA